MSAADIEVWVEVIASVEVLVTLGTNRTRRYWSVTRRFFDPGFVELVDKMIKDQPETDFWGAYAAVD